jgi:hypothetical protein
MNKKETIRRKNQRNMKYEIRSKGFNIEALRRECCKGSQVKHNIWLPDKTFTHNKILPMDNIESKTLIRGFLH